MYSRFNSQNNNTNKKDGVNINSNYSLKNSLQDYLKIISLEIVPELIDTNNWQNIEDIANILPQALTNSFFFEYPLENNSYQTDFSICTRAYEAGQRVLGDPNYSINLPPFLMHQLEWQNLVNFSKSWHQSSSPLSYLVHNVWLKFDLDKTKYTTPIPSVFLGLLPTETKEERKKFLRTDSHPLQWVTKTALPLLSKQQISKKVKNKILQCFDTLPEDAYVFQIGLMLAGKVDVVRLCIRNLEPQAIIPFLERMNWLGCTDSVSQLLKELSILVDRIDLEIDLGETIYPKIGLNCYLENQPSIQPKWSLFLDYLVTKGLCIPEKKPKLLNYPGYVRERHRSKFLSVSTSKLNQLLGTKYETIFFKGLHHIKLTYQNQEFLEAKAYLYVSHNRINVQEFKVKKKELI